VEVKAHSVANTIRKQLRRSALLVGHATGVRGLEKVDGRKPGVGCEYGEWR
jgi:hypothetical protein